MPRCAALKPDNTPCERIVGASQRFCYAHDPARKEERRRAASKAGKSRGRSLEEIREVKEQLKELASEIRQGGITREDATAINQVLNTLLRALEVERKIVEVDEQGAQLEALKQRYGLT